MCVNNVFQAAFAGCGLSLRSVQAGHAWKELDQRGRALHKQHPQASELGVMLRAGPHVIGELLCHHSLATAVEQARNCRGIWHYDAAFLATMAFLGDALQESAVPCLPELFDLEQREYHFLDKLSLPASPKALAEAWQSGDGRTRLQIAKLLAATFVTPGESRVSYEDDRKDQPAERVLPKYFGRWDLKKGSRVNCLGKAIMVAGFARLAGIRALAVIPTRLQHIEQYRSRGLAASVCLAGLKAASVPLSEARAHSLEDIARAGRRSADDYSWLHMSIALDMGGGEWALVDPNMGIASVLPKDWLIDPAADSLSYCSQVLPGLSLLKQVPDYRSIYADYLNLTRVNCALLIPFAAEGFSSTATKEQIVDRLVRSELLDHVLSWQEFGPSELDPDASRRRKAISALLEFTLDLTRPAVGGKPARKCLWFVFGEYPDDKLLAEISDEEAREALLTLCYKFASRAIRLMDEDVGRSRWFAELVHPQCQLSPVGFGLATAVMAHVGLSMGGTVSRQVEKRLNYHCFDLYRLHVSAGRLVTNPRKAGHEAQRSATILRRLPFVLPSSEHVLRWLERDADLCPTV